MVYGIRIRNLRGGPYVGGLVGGGEGIYSSGGLSGLGAGFDGFGCCGGCCGGCLGVSGLVGWVGVTGFIGTSSPSGLT